MLFRSQPAIAAGWEVGSDTEKLRHENEQLREEVAMWRSECVAARVALDELRKLLPGVTKADAPKEGKGFRFFGR